MNFEKISEKQYIEDGVNNYIAYEDIKLPKRATVGSAGYDIYSVTDFHIEPGEFVKVPTGIRVSLDSDKFLMIVPRSGLGFKYGTYLSNTAGIIDRDYYFSDNEGHIWVKMGTEKPVDIHKGDAICQGIICNFYKTSDDDTTELRNGGFGSTDK